MDIQYNRYGLYDVVLTKHELQTIAVACHTMAGQWAESQKPRDREASIELNIMVSRFVNAVLTTTGKSNEALNIS